MVSYAKTAEDVKATFPYGALLVQDNIPPVELANLEVRNDPDGKPVIRGWAYPNKDYVFDLDNVLLQQGGWLIFSRGKRIVLRPLTENQGKVAKDKVDFA